ncbi:MAG TPA: Uma2 family endonuclease [Chthoniobacterales bacterium]|nr:Uma2 family endonuclease [Chthoniobacterales bacterium]
MLQVTHRPMTVHDYLLLPDNGPRFQLIDGQFHMAPAPNTYHQIISRNLQYIVMRFLEDNPVGELFGAPFDVYLSDVDVFQPDLCVFSKEQLHYLNERGATSAPWLVVEILSPSSLGLDRGPKREVYARCGTRELWLIDPDKKEIAIYDLRADAERPAKVAKEPEAIRTPLFAGLEVSLAQVFRR